MARGLWSPPAIRDYGLLGDTQTAALASSGGSIDWMCWPRFDSQPIFGRLVDPEHGGSFEISVPGTTHTTRRYRDRSAVLETAWRSAGGEATLTEAMGMGTKSQVLVRVLSCTAGRISATVLYDPRPGLPGTTRACQVKLLTKPELPVRRGVPARFELAQGETVAMVLADRADPVDAGQAGKLIDRADRWWRKWSDEIRCGQQYREVLVRSLINLRLLTYTPTGAPVAAPTTSLPEELGGARNWDYRLSWPRDASVGVAAFLAVGKYKEARSFVKWLVSRACTGANPIRVLYDLDGKNSKPEREIREAAGYLESRPVRTGNLAAAQHQLDVYGWVIDALWNLVEVDGKLGLEGRRALRAYSDYVVANWRRPRGAGTTSGATRTTAQKVACAGP